MTRRTRRVCWLAELELFADSNDAELQAAAGLLTPVRVLGGTLLMRERSIGREFFVVADGGVGVSRDRDDGTEMLAVLGPGAVLGEMSLLHGTPRSATATTLVPTTVYAASAREFVSLLDAVPAAAERIIEAATSRSITNAAA